jgi:hypothetical protein
LKQKNENYYKFINMNALVFEDHIILTLKIAQKTVVASIHYLLKKKINNSLKSSLKSKN